MDVEIQGYSTFRCAHCLHPHNLDSKALAFKENLDHDAILETTTRYLAHYQSTCKHCHKPLGLCVEVWEEPPGVSNSIHYQEHNVAQVDGEFSISYYDHDNHAMESYSEEDEASFDNDGF